MDSKLFGGILLIIGTTIAAGMLALPIATSQLGFFYSTLLLILCWFVMTSSALLILEVNSWLPLDNNIISMAKTTLGGAGQAVAWCAYMLLLYSLMAAYITGGGDFLQHLLLAAHVNILPTSACALFTGVIACIVYAGIRSVDYVNRGLMFSKLTAYVLLVALIFPHVSLSHLMSGEATCLSSITVVLTSFGFSLLVPSLRLYFNNDKAKLKKAIIIGSVIPLICYILWNMSIMGVIGREGDNGLVAMLTGGRSTAEFVEQLQQLLHNNILTGIARFFTSICLATGFLGVSIGLLDFLSDGLGLARNKKNRFVVSLIAFVPPLVIALFYPGAFIKALSYAGIDCIILMIILPVLMTWSGRYRKNIASGYQVRGGKALLIFLLLFSAITLSVNI